MAEENKNQLIMYTAQNGETKIRVSIDPKHNTVWLTQAQMAELFETTKQNVSLHINNIFDGGELKRKATVKEYLTVQQEGEREVARKIEYYTYSFL